MAITALNSLEHDTLNGIYNSLVKIDDTHFILAYTGDGNDGFIKTFSVDANYAITEIDVLEHNTGIGTYSSLVMLDSRHFALAYTGDAFSDGYIATFSIDANYDNITEIDEIEHNTDNGTHNSLVKIDSTHFILAHAGTSANHGLLKTFSVDANCDNITQIDSVEFDAVTGAFNSIVMIDSTHFILSYSGDASDGYLATFSIDGSYDNITQIDLIEHDTVNGTYNSLVMIDSTHFMLAYSGSGADGYVKTFSIDGSFDNITEIASLEHDTTNGIHNSLVKLDSTHYLLAYTDTDGDGKLKLFTIDGSYGVSETASLEFDTADATYQSLCAISASHVILAYAGVLADGYIATFSTGIAASTNATIDGVIAESVAVGIDATVSVTQSATISGVIAESIASGIDATVGVIQSATIDGVIAESVASANDSVIYISTIARALDRYRLGNYSLTNRR